MLEPGTTSSLLSGPEKLKYKQRIRSAQISVEVWNLLDTFVRTNRQFKKVYFTDAAIIEAIKWQVLQMSDADKAKQPVQVQELFK